jgi:hypothetical protein
MKVSTHQSMRRTSWLMGLGLAATITATGCQVDVGGLTLPSPYWQQDDIQYFPAGHEFKLYNEAAAMKAAQAQQIPAAPVAPPPGVPLPPGGGFPGGGFPPDMGPGAVVPIPE